MTERVHEHRVGGRKFVSPKKSEYVRGKYASEKMVTNMNESYMCNSRIYE